MELLSLAGGWKTTTQVLSSLIDPSVKARSVLYYVPLDITSCICALHIKMHPRFRLLQSGRSIALVPRVPSPSSYQIPLCLRLQQRRSITADEKPLPEAEQPKGPNQQQLPHVSEEAADLGEITGEGGPDLDQSTPVSEVRS